MDTNSVQKVNSFEEYKKMNKNRIIIEKCKAYLDKDPNLTTKDLGKKLGVSDATISRAWDTTPIEEKQQKKSKVDWKGMLDILLKGGLGIGGISVLSNPAVMKNLQEDIGKFLIDNRYLNYGIIGLGIVWEKFVKVKINSPKNDLSELEIIIRLIESNFSYIIAIALGIFILIGQKDNIVEFFLESKKKIMEIFDPEAFKTLFNIEDTNAFSTVKNSEGKEFPMIAGWRDIYNTHNAQKGLTKQETFVQNIHDIYGFYYPSIVKGMFPLTTEKYVKCKDKWFKEDGIVSELTPPPSIERGSTTEQEYGIDGFG